MKRRHIRSDQIRGDTDWRQRLVEQTPQSRARSRLDLAGVEWIK